MDNRDSTCCFCIRPPVSFSSCVGLKVCSMHLNYFSFAGASQKKHTYEEHLDLNLINFEGFYGKVINLSSFYSYFKELGIYSMPYNKLTCINTLLAQKNEIFTEAHTSIIIQIIYCPGKNIIVTYGLDSYVRVFDFSTKFQLYQRSIGKIGVLNNKSSIIAVSKHNDFIISQTQDSRTFIWYYKENKTTYLSVPLERANSIFLLSNDDTLIFATSYKILVLEISKNQVITIIGELKHDFITEISETGKIITVSRKYNNNIFVFDALSGEQQLSLNQNYHAPFIAKLNFSEDLLGIAYSNMIIVLWDLKKQVIRCEFQGHDEKIQFIIFDSNSSYLISGGLNSYILFWSLQTNSIEKKLEIGNLGISSASLIEDHNYLAVGYQDNTLKFINLANIEDVSTVPGHTDQVLSLAITKSYKKLASGSHDKKIIIWNIINKEFFNIFNAHDSCVNCLAFSNNEDFLASGGLDMAVKVWNCESLDMICRFDGHDLRIEQVFVSSDDKLIVSASMDYKFKLWEIGGECKGLAYFDELDEKIRGFSKSRKYLIVSSKLFLKIIKFVNISKQKLLT